MKKRNIDKALLLSPYEISVFLHNAELSTAQGVEANETRERIVRIWKSAFHERIKVWLEAKLLTKDEVVFILVSTAKEIFGENTNSNSPTR